MPMAEGDKVLYPSDGWNTNNRNKYPDELLPDISDHRSGIYMKGLWRCGGLWGGYRSKLQEKFEYYSKGSRDNKLLAG